MQFATIALIVAAMAASADAWENRGSWGQNKGSGWNQVDAVEGLEAGEGEEMKWGGRRGNDPEWAERSWGNWNDRNSDDGAESVALGDDGEDAERGQYGNRAYGWSMGGSDDGMEVALGDDGEDAEHGQYGNRAYGWSMGGSDDGMEVALGDDGEDADFEHGQYGNRSYGRSMGGRSD